MHIQQLTLELLLRNLSTMAEKLVVETRKEREQAIVLEVLSRIERYTHLNLSDVAKELGLDVTRLYGADANGPVQPGGDAAPGHGPERGGHCCRHRL